jgi:hypothetical protein
VCPNRGSGRDRSERAVCATSASCSAPPLRRTGTAAAAALLDLIDQKRQHHQVHEHGAEVVVAVAEVGLVQRCAVQIAETVTYPLGVGELNLARLGRGRHSIEQVGVIARLGAEDEAQIELLQLADVRGIGGKGVFDDAQLQMRMRAAQVRQQALGGVALAVVLACTVLFEDGCLRMGSGASGNTSL